MPRPFMLWPSHPLPHVFLACKLPAFLLFPTPFPPKDSKISRSVQEEDLDQGWTCGGQGLEAAKRVSRTGVKAEMWISEASFCRDPEME